MNNDFLLKMKKFPKAVIISSDIYPESEIELKNLGIKVIYSFENPNVHPALSKHPDMQIVSMANNKYICAPETYDYYSTVLKEFDIDLQKGDTYLSSNYPGDIAYNITVTGKCAVHNFKYTDKVLKDNIAHLHCIHVSQGYCGCTVCKISDDAFVTSDRGVEKVLTKNGYDVFLISEKGIQLPGFDRGFIGGSSFKIAPNILCINGNIKTLPGFESIISFCNRYDVNIFSLSDKQITDIGSAICVY